MSATKISKCFRRGCATEGSNTGSGLKIQGWLRKPSFFVYNGRMRPPTTDNEIVSRVMRANKGKGTAPELAVRKVISTAGFKGYRLNWPKAPSRPDIAFVNKKVAVIVDGCFWHGCRRCVKSTPKTNKKYWSWKIETNRSRDKKNLARLKRQGWLVYRLWEHDVKKGDLKEMTSWLERSLKMRA